MAFKRGQEPITKGPLNKSMVGCDSGGFFDAKTYNFSTSVHLVYQKAKGYRMSSKGNPRETQGNLRDLRETQFLKFPYGFTRFPYGFLRWFPYGLPYKASIPSLGLGLEASSHQRLQAWGECVNTQQVVKYSFSLDALSLYFFLRALAGGFKPLKALGLYSFLRIWAGGQRLKA